MGKKAKRLASIFVVVIVVLLPITGAYFGFTVGRLWAEAQNEGARANWQFLGSPPGSISRVVGADMESVYVEVASGQVYRGARECGGGASGCWEIATEIRQEPYFAISSRCDTHFTMMEDPPAEVVQCASVVTGGPSENWEAHYALLEDGNIWVWHYVMWNLEFPLLQVGFIVPCVGMVVGALGGICVACGMIGLCLVVVNLRKAEAA
jgi:hypothetical protein